MAAAAELLARARAIFDDPKSGLAAAVRVKLPAGFAAGAEWMRLAMQAVRGSAPTGSTGFVRLGCVKYGLAMLPALASAAVAAFVSWWLLPVAVIAFYAVECRMVFAFPLALDGSRRPLRDSDTLVAANLSWPRAVARVMRIAAEMLVGGLLGRGFARSWCVGCLAVVLWYVELAPDPRVVEAEP